MATLRKMSEPPAKSTVNPKPEPKKTPPTVSGNQQTQIVKTEAPVKAQSPKPEAAEKPVVPAYIYYGGANTVRGVVNSQNVRAKLGRQIRKDVGSYSALSGVINSLMERASSSGSLSARDAKKAILAAREKGHISRSQAGRIINHMGI